MKQKQTFYFINFIKFIIFRISGFLNLNGTSAVSSESYQVVNYGLAGQYIHHFDAVSSTVHYKYSRISSTIQYRYIKIALQYTKRTGG